MKNVYIQQFLCVIFGNLTSGKFAEVILEKGNI